MQAYVITLYNIVYKWRKFAIFLYKTNIFNTEFLDCLWLLVTRDSWVTIGGRRQIWGDQNSKGDREVIGGIKCPLRFKARICSDSREYRRFSVRRMMRDWDRPRMVVWVLKRATWRVIIKFRFPLGRGKDGRWEKKKVNDGRARIQGGKGDGVPSSVVIELKFESS